MFLSPAPLPVRRSALPELVRARILEAVQPLTFTPDPLRDPRVYTEQARPDEPAKVKPPWARVICMIPRVIRPREGSVQNPDRVETVDLVLRCEAATDADGKTGWDYARALENLRDAAFPLLEGWSPYPAEATGAQPGAHVTYRPASWAGQRNPVPGRDDDADLWVVEYAWHVILGRAS